MGWTSPKLQRVGSALMGDGLCSYLAAALDVQVKNPAD
jgi:hypothetical protein